MSSMIYESAKLKVAMEACGKGLKFSFSGSIDEDFHCENLLKQTPLEVHIDFKGVKMINSCGIREWVKYVEKIGSKTPIFYYNCPQIIVQQMNMVAGFLTSSSTVKTFAGPYFCEACDEEHVLPLESAQLTGGKAPGMKCPSCQGEMEFDAIEKQYFQFLKIHKQAA